MAKRKNHLGRGTTILSAKSDGYALLGRYLKTQRHIKGFNKTKLSQRLGVSHTTITDVEDHERRIDVVELVRHCQALGVLPEEALLVVIKAERSGDADRSQSAIV